jgi:hypothetical protein
VVEGPVFQGRSRETTEHKATEMDTTSQKRSMTIICLGSACSKSGSHPQTSAVHLFVSFGSIARVIESNDSKQDYRILVIYLIIQFDYLVRNVDYCSRNKQERTEPIGQYNIPTDNKHLSVKAWLLVPAPLPIHIARNQRDGIHLE